MSEVVKWLWVAFLVFAVVASITSIGRTPSPSNPKVVALTTLVQGLLIASILTYWVK